MDQDSSLLHLLTESTSQPHKHSIWRWDVLLLALLGLVKLKPPKICPTVLLRLFTSSTAPVKWTTNPWATFTRGWPQVDAGDASMSSTDSCQKYCLYVQYSSRVSLMPLKKTKKDSSFKVIKSHLISLAVSSSQWTQVIWVEPNSQRVLKHSSDQLQS